MQNIMTFGFAFAKELHRPILEKIWGKNYKILKTPYSLGKKLAELMVEKTYI